MQYGDRLKSKRRDVQKLNYETFKYKTSYSLYEITGEYKHLVSLQKDLLDVDNID